MDARWLGLALVVACSEDRSPDVGTGTDDEEAGDDTAVVPGPELDTATDTGTAPEPPTETEPAVPERHAVASVFTVAGEPHVTVSFTEAVPFTLEPPAAAVVVGACVHNTYDPPSGSDVETWTVTFLAVEAARVTLDGTVVPLAPSLGGFETALPAWPAGQVVGFSGGGDDFPEFAFEEMIAVPAALDLEDEPTDLDRSTDLELAWASAHVETTVTIRGELENLLCTFASGTEVATVPAEALAHLAPGAVTITVQRTALATEPLATGEWVDARAFLYETWPATLGS